MSATKPGKPRIEIGKPLRIAGLRCHYTPETMREIANQWQRFAPMICAVPGQIERVSYGLCFNAGNGIDYLSGVEVSDSAALPADLSVVNVPGQTYAVYLHRAHVSSLRETMEAIGNESLTASGYHRAQTGAGAPDFFERYGEEFNPITGMGGIEVWVPIKD